MNTKFKGCSSGWRQGFFFLITHKMTLIVGNNQQNKIGVSKLQFTFWFHFPAAIKAHLLGELPAPKNRN